MQPIEQNGPGFYYNIKYRRQNLPTNPAWEVFQIMEPTKNSHMVPNQETYVPYDIMVIAFNGKGQSKGKTDVHTGKIYGIRRYIASFRDFSGKDLLPEKKLSYK